MAGAFACPPHALLHVEEPRVPADAAADHLDPVEGAHPAAVTQRVAGDRDAPAICLHVAEQPRPHHHRHPSEVVERERAAVVQLEPEVEIPGPADVVRDMRFRQAERRRLAVCPDFLAHAQEGIHRQPLVRSDPRRG